MIKVAINGFGRIGRLAFRKIHEMDDIDVVAINDLSDPVQLSYLLKYDSTQGSYHGHDIKVIDDTLIVDHDKIKIFSEKDASNLPWKDLDVDIVLECTGFYTSKEKSMAHIKAGAKKVLISAPAGNDIKTVVYGVNHQILTKDDIIVSGASCTTNCLAPMAKALASYRELRTGFMTTIHAYTGNQKFLDAPADKGNLRRSRAAALNIVPTTTGAASAIGLVIPELDGKLLGSAQRVPVATGSITILDATLKDETDSVNVSGINECMKAASNESFGYTEEEIVSSDVIGTIYGSLFDATQTEVQKCGTHIYEVRVVSWYDNEMGYTAQLIRTFKHMSSL